jgi:hypothetical protein
MAIRNDFAPGEVLAAADLNDTFGSKLPYAFGTATPTTTESGFLWYDSTGAPSKPTPKFWDGSAFVPLGGKILQIVRATDTTNRSTTSTSYTDVTGMSVTITPQKSDSALILIATGWAQTSWGSGNTSGWGQFAITDSSANEISGAQNNPVGIDGQAGVRDFYASIALIAYATPATTSAVTYKLQFKSSNASTTIRLSNGNNTGQMYAIEVSA